MKSIRIAIAGALALAVVVVAFRVIRPPEPSQSHELLREVYSPRFSSVPPPPPVSEMLTAIPSQLRFAWTPPFSRTFLTTQAGTLWIALLVLVVVGFNAERPLHARNVDLLAIFLLGACFFNLLGLARVRDPFWLRWMWWVFGAIVALSVSLAVRAVWRVAHPFRGVWQPAIARRTLVAFALALLALDISAALVREPDDSGYFVNLGAQRLRERGRLPYGDPLLTSTPGAAYGPLLYVAQVPFQWLVDPLHLNEASTPRPPLGSDSQYRLPSPLASKLCTVAFLLLGLWAMFRAASRFGSQEIAWALVALYCGSAFVIGMGGEEYYLGGVTYISHIAPPAVATAAFAALPRPALSGVLLAAAAGCGFYPAFLLPAFAGYYWDRRRDLGRFLGGLAAAGVFLGVFVLACSRPAGGRGLIGTILWDTFGHHSDPAGYGSSPFGFWGQRTGFHAWLIQPLVGTSGLAAPVMLFFFGFAASCFWLARRRGARELALLASAVVIGSNLVKIHATGTYVAWFYPFLLLGLFLPARADGSVTIVDSACPKRTNDRPS